MKTIEHISVKCTYRAGLSKVEVPDEVYDQLQENQEFSSDDSRNQDALEWLGDNIREADAYDWEFDVDI